MPVGKRTYKKKTYPSTSRSKRRTARVTAAATKRAKALRKKRSAKGTKLSKAVKRYVGSQLRKSKVVSAIVPRMQTVKFTMMWDEVFTIGNSNNTEVGNLFDQMPSTPTGFYAQTVYPASLNSPRSHYVEYLGGYRGARMSGVPVMAINSHANLEPAAYFTASILTALGLTTADEAAGKLNSLYRENAQPGNIDQWDKFFRDYSVKNAMLTADMICDTSQPLLVSYGTKKAYLTGKQGHTATTGSEASVVGGTLRYESENFTIQDHGTQNQSLVTQVVKTGQFEEHFDATGKPYVYDSVGAVTAENQALKTHPLQTQQNRIGVKKFVINGSPEGQSIRKVIKMKYDRDLCHPKAKWADKKAFLTCTNDDDGSGIPGVFASSDTAMVDEDDQLANAAASGNTAGDLSVCSPFCGGLFKLAIQPYMPIKQQPGKFDYNRQLDASGQSFSQPSGATVGETVGPSSHQFFNAATATMKPDVIRIRYKLVQYAQLSRPANEIIDNTMRPTAT